MLKQLRINLMLEKAKRSLAELIEQKKGFETRKSDIEKRFAEAGAVPDADITKIETDLTALEDEVNKSDIDKKTADIEAEITRLENELKEIGKPEAPAENKNEKGEKTMITNSVSGAYTLRSRLIPLVERQEVKDWLGQLRAYGSGETRAVTGAELNIPQIILEPMRENVATYSKLLKYVNFKSLKGKARQPVVGTVPEAVWMEMAGALNELEFGFNMVEADGYKVGGFIPVPNSILQDSDINLLTEITGMISKSIAYGVDKAIMYGGGVKQPLGIIPRLAAATAPRDFGTNAPTYTDLSSSHIKDLSSASLTATAMFAELAEGLGVASSKYASGGKFWAMSETTFMTLQAKLITINAAGAIASAASMVMPIVGGDIVLLDFMPDNIIAGGYGGLYLLVEREGATISKSEHVQFIQENTIFKGTARYDGLPVIGEGFAMFTLATSSGATSATFAEDTADATAAYLTELSGTDITLSPTFDSGTLSYTADVANAVTSTTITATARTYGKVNSIKVGTTAATAGACSLAVGANTINVEVQYGTSKRTYKIVVTRAAT